MDRWNEMSLKVMSYLSTESIQERPARPLDGVVAKIQTSEGKWDGDIRPDDL